MNQKEIQEKIDLVMSDPRFFGDKLSAYEVVKEVYDLSEDHADIFGNSTPKDMIMDQSNLLNPQR